MRKSPLTKAEKEEAEQLLKKLNVMPPVAGQIVLNVDGQGKIGSVEMNKLVWR